MQLFVEKGVAETTVRDIAQAVGLSEGALYRHFTGKDELVWQLFERKYTEFAGRLGTLAAAESSTREKVAAMIRGFCQAHDENPILFRFLVFTQHGQLGRLAETTPTPVVRDARRHRARHRVWRDSETGTRSRGPRSSSALCSSPCSLPPTGGYPRT
jgi:AcrR family transcriptional regulator